MFLAKRRVTETDNRPMGERFDEVWNEFYRNMGVNKWFTLPLYIPTHLFGYMEIRRKANPYV